LKKIYVTSPRTQTLYMKYILLLLTLAGLFSGCQKFADLYPQHWGSPPFIKPCKIDSIYPVEKGDGAFNTWTAVGIKYNQKGNPVQLNYSIMMYALVQFPVYYKYDNKDRLVEIVGSISDPTFDYLYTAPLHIKYVYEGNSRMPIRDSFMPGITMIWQKWKICIMMKKAG
jgi:hypothetical protein